MRHKSFQRIVSSIALACLLSVVAGCGGGGKGDTNAITENRVETFGPVTTHVAGRTQTPVTATNGNLIITGVAGAAFSEMTAHTVSPQKIVWQAYRNGTFEILMANADGSGPTLNISDSKEARHNYVPQWSPDGTKILWYGLRNGAEQVLVKNADGTGSELALTHSPSGDHNYEPSWSPDGTKVVWEGVRGLSRQIFVTNADGSGSEISITNSPPRENNTSPRWSPDGSKIAWCGTRGGNEYQILVKNANGSGDELRLTNSVPATRNFSPQWSPDSRRLVWQGTRGVTSFQVVLANADGTGTESVLTNTGQGGSNDTPQWSPDGNKILWYGIRGNPPTSSEPILGPHKILVTSADGSGGELHIGDSTLGSNKTPDWSPDGSKIVWSGYRGVNTQILVQNINGNGGELALTNTTDVNGMGNLNPQWSPAYPARTLRLLGTDGPLGATAAGFLVSQQSDTLMGLVTFDTTPANRGSMRVKTQVVPGDPTMNLIFTVTAADTLTNLKYMVGNDSSAVITAIGPGGVTVSIKGALISFEAATGKPALVAPYTANNAQDGISAPERTGDIVTYRGKFPAVFDGMGVNRAPDGATEIQINARTGALVLIR